MKHHPIIRVVFHAVLAFLLALMLGLFVHSCFTGVPAEAEVEEAAWYAETQEAVRMQAAEAVEEAPVTEPAVQETPAEPIAPVAVVEDKAEPAMPEAQTEPAVLQTPVAGPVSEPAVEAEIVVDRKEAVRVPAAPSSLRVTEERPLVPGAPFLYEPYVIPQDEYEQFYSAPEGSADADPFSDFYIAGEGDAGLLYDDGTYYPAFYMNGEYYGDVETRFSGTVRSVNMEQIADLIGDQLTGEASQRLFGDGFSFLSLDDVSGRGFPLAFDGVAFALYLTVDANDLSLRTISISPRSSNRRDQYAMTGAEPLDAARFSWVASLNGYGSFSYPDDFDDITSRSVSLYVNNRLTFLQTGLDFSFSLFNRDRDSLDRWDKNLGNWVAFHEFLDQSIRFSFGSVGSNLSDRTESEMGINTNIGFQFEKDYGYGGSVAPGNQYSSIINVVEPSEVIVVVNDTEDERGDELPTKEALKAAKEDRIVFSRELQPGSYRLKDFLFTQGLNKIKIYVYPDARPDEPDVYYLDTSYDSRLMAAGESSWGMGVSMPKGLTDRRDAAGRLHYYDGVRESWASYYPQYFTARWWQTSGITDTLTLNTDISATPGAFSGTLGSVWANRIGTTQAQGTVRFSEAYERPLVSASMTERFNDQFMHGLGSLSLSFSYTGSGDAKRDFDRSDIVRSLSSSFSYAGRGLVTRLRYSLSGSLSYAGHNDHPTWSLSASTGTSLGRGFSVSASATVSASDPEDPSDVGFTATVSAAYAYASRLNASSSTSFGDDSDVTSNLAVTYRPGKKDSLSLSLSGIDWEDDPADHNFYASWTHSGDLGAFSIRQQASQKYERLTTSANFSTSLAFADGALGIARSIGDVYLLVRPIGSLRHADVSVARSMDNEPSVITRHLGSALYTDLTPYSPNNVVVYAGGSEGSGSGQTYLFRFTPRARNAYVARIDLPDEFTVSGMLYHGDGTVYEQYSSPVYRVSHTEDGSLVLEADDALYLFTDQVGRYILSNVPSGSYAFDLQVDEQRWMLVRFEVPQMHDKKLRVIGLSDVYDDGPYADQAVDGYEQVIDAEVVLEESEDDFWNRLFPPDDELSFGFEEPVDAGTGAVVQQAAP